MKPCVVSVTTLLCLLKFNPILGPVKFFSTTKCSGKALSPMLYLNMVVAFGFWN